MLTSGFQKFWWTVLAGLLLIGAILIGKTVLAKSAILSADAAVNLALSYGNSNIYLEWDNRPSGIFGKVMKYGEAVQYKTTQPIPPQENIARMSDVPVWLILLQGDFVEHIPAAPGSPGIPEKEIHHDQIALIINGVSGDTHRSILGFAAGGSIDEFAASFDAAVGYRAPRRLRKAPFIRRSPCRPPDRPVRHHRTDLKEVTMRFHKTAHAAHDFHHDGLPGSTGVGNPDPPAGPADPDGALRNLKSPHPFSHADPAVANTFLHAASAHHRNPDPSCHHPPRCPPAPPSGRCGIPLGGTAGTHPGRHSDRPLCPGGPLWAP